MQDDWYWAQRLEDKLVGFAAGVLVTVLCAAGVAVFL
jgi:hypothetical protein